MKGVVPQSCEDRSRRRLLTKKFKMEREFLKDDTRPPNEWLVISKDSRNCYRKAMNGIKSNNSIKSIEVNSIALDSEQTVIEGIECT